MTSGRQGVPVLQSVVLDAPDVRALAEEPLRVYADPAGHPFCIVVGP